MSPKLGPKPRIFLFGEREWRGERKMYVRIGQISYLEKEIEREKYVRLG
jgi:hypothetical protein